MTYLKYTFPESSLSNFVSPLQRLTRNLILPLSITTVAVTVVEVKPVEARMIPVCISHIPDEYGSARVEIGICEFYSHHNGNRPYMLEGYRNTSIKDRLHIGKMFGIVWGDTLNLLGNIINTINETLSLVIFWALHIKLIYLAGALFNLLLSILILVVDICILLLEITLFFIFIPLAFFL
ncbi:hypothetical protein [Cyanobacterium aponinum]|uniref:hypothetical protein n=1 Tax=Cyanobacterium aponinum TaxID=379064 RepID=UPI000C12BDDB|nr:hypothetical protein [Cyanobacterium aponinum]PHV62710.1 hypothetical protein CSQ80_09040 [Cyanobacterium aponinum IPPAS B-1201]